MKILVLQLARLGDLYLSWPALRSLRRQHPEAEIHLLVRPRFEVATKGLDAVDRVIALPTEEWAEPLVRPEGRTNDDEALARVTASLDGLRGENYDRIINFSFSPLSSWIVASIAPTTADVSGYTRHADGFLCVPDDPSAFFYAQVGTERPNRVHLTDVFAAVAGVGLDEEDFRAPTLPERDFGIHGPYIVVHPGASEAHKRLPAFQWARVIKHFHDLHPEVLVVVIGSAGESAIANEIRANLPAMPLLDLTGQTAVEDLFGLLKHARLLAGGDSGPMHMAMLEGTPTFNISVGAVNFWETGPRSRVAWVLSLADSASLSSRHAGEAMAAIYAGREVPHLIRHVGGTPAFRLPAGSVDNDFAWRLIQGIYLGGEFPVTEDPLFVQAAEKMREMNDVVMTQLRELPVESERLGPLLDRADEILEAIGKMVPDAGVLSRWVMAEKSRIPPCSRAEIRESLARIHEDLGRVLHLYMMETAERKRHGAF